MKRFIAIAFTILAFSCKDKKVNLSGDAPVKAKDFFAVFKTAPLPLTIADSNVLKIADTVTISPKVFAQFVSDSVLAMIVKDVSKTTIRPIGKIVKDKEVYLLVDLISGKKVTVATFVFDKKDKLLAAKTLFTNNNNDGYEHTLSINKEPTFTVSKEKLEKEKLSYTHIGWAYTSDSTFTVIVNDTNEDEKKNNTVINPIDTLARKNKLSGNYVKDSKNFLSLRDGKTANSYHFFIHFENSNTDCSGELKGEVNIENGKGIYKQNGDPCVIDFKLEGNEITVKEQGNCGNHRGIKCFFNDSFVKQKEKVEKKKKK